MNRRQIIKTALAYIAVLPSGVGRLRASQIDYRATSCLPSGEHIASYQTGIEQIKTDLSQMIDAAYCVSMNAELAELPGEAVVTLRLWKHPPV